MTTAYMIPIAIEGGGSSDVITAAVNGLVGANIGFTQISPITNGGNHKAVQYNNLIINFADPTSASINVSFYTKFTNQQTVSMGSVTAITTYESSSSETIKGINLCVVKSGNTFMAVNFAKKGVYPGNGTLSAFNSSSNDVEVCYTSADKGYFTDGNECKLLLKRTYRQAEGVFFCNEGLPVKDTSTGEFVSDLPDVYNLGGVQIGKWYKMTDNTNYYGVMNNIAVAVDNVVRPQTAGG